MSRASWYRHGKPTAKPVKRTQAMIARMVGCSVRTVQRMVKELRDEHDARIRELILQGLDDQAIVDILGQEMREGARCI
jgi:DNA-binding Lrp family transcriptional regulator